MAYAEKYVTADAVDGVGDGSESNPWSFSDALANATAGDRVNVQSGSYTIASGASLTNAGTSASFICFCGYNTTIGDLDEQGRNTDTSLNTTNFPVLSLSGNLVLSSYTLFMNFDISGAYNGDLIGDLNNDRMWIYQCKVQNTYNGSSANGIRCDDGLFLVECDVYSGPDTFAYAVRCDYQSVFASSRFIALGTTSLYMFRINNIISIGNFVSGNGNSAFNLGNTIYVQTLFGNTFYDCADIVRHPNTASTCLLFLMNNHVTDSDQWINNLYSATSDIAMFEINNRLRDITTERTGVGDGLLLGQVDTDEGGPETDYVDAGNNDLRLLTTAAGKDAGKGFSNP